MEKLNFGFLKPLKSIEQHWFDQEEGTWLRGRPCCFGARLAKALNLYDDFGEYYFTLGKDYFLSTLGINEAQMILLFRQAGLKTINPFSGQEWNLPVAQVIENLEKITEIPKTRGADFRVSDLEHADLTGADLRGADFRGAFLRNTIFENADLRGANFSGADLHWAHLRDADLRKANLEGADLERANLHGAKLEGALGLYS